MSTTCECYETRHLPSDWPRCDGIVRAYPSGNRACDCGQHVIKPTPAAPASAGGS